MLRPLSFGLFEPIHYAYGLGNKKYVRGLQKLERVGHDLHFRLIRQQADALSTYNSRDVA